MLLSRPKKGIFLCPPVDDLFFCPGELRFHVHQVTVLVVPAALVLLQLLAGAELLPNAEHAGKDTLRWDLQICGEKGPPMEVFRRAALKTENMVDRGDHQVKVLLPINQASRRLFALASMTWIYEIGEGLESSIGI